jgi:electron transfer flavoprotein beta subunit
MRIIVCVKQIRHLYARTGDDPAQGYITEKDQVCRINPYDEAAFELALHLKQSINGCDLVLLTLGPLIAEKQIRKCLSKGGDSLVQVEIGNVNREPDPWLKSLWLAEAVRELNGDLVLCGKESLDRRNGQVAAMLATRLNRPYIQGITTIEIDSDKKQVKVSRKAGRGKRQLWKCGLPSVFSVDQIQEQPTIALLKNRYLAEEGPIRILNMSHFQREEKCHQHAIYTPRPRPKPVQAPDSQLTSFDRIRNLLTGSRINKKGEILRGASEVQVEGVVDFLEVNGFL